MATSKDAMALMSEILAVCHLSLDDVAILFNMDPGLLAEALMVRDVCAAILALYPSLFHPSLLSLSLPPSLSLSFPLLSL